MNRAVFLDRDGTVNEEVGYLSDLEELRLISGAGRAICKLNQAGFKVILVTNQSGVARGYFPETLVHEAHERLGRMLHSEGAQIDAVYYCPHHPTAGDSRYTVDCNCRKPKTGLIDKAVKDFSIDRAHSYMIGDKWSDIEVGLRAGLQSILVLTGFGPDAGNKKPDHVRGADFTAKGLLEAADWIISREAVNSNGK